MIHPIRKKTWSNLLSFFGVCNRKKIINVQSNSSQPAHLEIFCAICSKKLSVIQGHLGDNQSAFTMSNPINSYHRCTCTCCPKHGWQDSKYECGSSIFFQSHLFFKDSKCLMEFHLFEVFTFVRKTKRKF